MRVSLSLPSLPSSPLCAWQLCIKLVERGGDVIHFYVLGSRPGPNVALNVGRRLAQETLIKGGAREGGGKNPLTPVQCRGTTARASIASRCFALSWDVIDERLMHRHVKSRNQRVCCAAGRCARSRRSSRGAVVDHYCTTHLVPTLRKVCRIGGQIPASTDILGSQASVILLYALSD